MMTTFVEDYLSSPRDFYNQTEYMIQYWNNIKQLKTLSKDFTSSMQILTNTDFFNYIDQRKALTTELTIISTIVIAFVTIITLLTGLEPINSKGTELKRILKLIPIEIVMRNRWLRTYIVQTSGKLGDSIKRLA
jgi:hypothetical protein